MCRLQWQLRGVLVLQAGLGCAAPRCEARLFLFIFRARLHSDSLAALDLQHLSFMTAYFLHLRASFSPCKDRPYKLPCTKSRCQRCLPCAGARVASLPVLRPHPQYQRCRREVRLAHGALGHDFATTRASACAFLLIVSQPGSGRRWRHEVDDGPLQ